VEDTSGRFEKIQGDVSVMKTGNKTLKTNATLTWDFKELGNI